MSGCLVAPPRIGLLGRRRGAMAGHEFPEGVTADFPAYIRAWLFEAAVTVGKVHNSTVNAVHLGRHADDPSHDGFKPISTSRSPREHLPAVPSKGLL